MEGNRTVVAWFSTQARWGPAAGLQPQLPDRDHLCAQNRHPLAIPAQGTWLRQRRHLLASFAGLDTSRRLAQGACQAPEDLRAAGPIGPLSWRHRQRQRAGAFWGAHTGPNPTDRAKKGCKRHLLTDGNGVPLIVRTTAANVPDGSMAITLLDHLPPLHGRRGRPRLRPRELVGDRAYGSLANQVRCACRGVIPMLAAKHEPHGSGLGRARYVVERTLAWFSNFRRIKLCYEKCGQHFQALHDLTAALICANKLRLAG